MRGSGWIAAETAPGSPADPSVEGADASRSSDLNQRVAAINDGGLAVQVSYVVHAVGKARARRYLRDATAFELVPRPDMFGV